MAQATFTDESELWEAFESYEEWVEENPIPKTELLRSGADAGLTVKMYKERPLSIESFCVHAGITSKTFRTWRNEGKYSTTIEKIDDKIFSYQQERAIIDEYNAGIVAMQLGMKQKQEIAVTELAGFKILKA